MPPSPSIQSFKQFRDVVYNFRISRIIFTALDLDLFNQMGNRAWTIAQLSKRVQTSQRGLEILCRSLASTGLIGKTTSGFRVSRFAKTYLQKNSKEFRGDYLTLMQRQWKEWSRLTEVVTSGIPVDHEEPETPEYRRSFSWAMHHRSLDPAQQVAQQISMKSARSFLDLGGGPGTYAMAFLKKNPQLHASVMDRHAALEVASILAKELAIKSRLSLHPGNFLENKIPGKYDIVWYSNVLHIYSPAENLKIFKKIKYALNPGGRLLIQDTFLQDPQGLRPLETNLFAVTMLLYTETGNTYPLQDVRSWLQKAGLNRTRILRMKQGTGDWDGQILEARKPTASKIRGISPM